ncbi:MAG: MlaD family protein [Treponema sp.]|jgi:phospholipid/cholesterol/gamma-HCH transport system substrate-binding protein|nr:MlaD family protein [Treponema sp.]
MMVSRYVKIALLFIVLGVGGSIYIIATADGLSNFDLKPYYVTLQDATGLSSRSKVYLAGVAVGRVQNVSLENNAAHLKIGFLRDVEIHRDAYVSRRSSSILGTAVLYLEPGTELGPLLPPGSVINAEKNSGDIGAVVGTVQELGEQITQTLREFQDNQLVLLSMSLENIRQITDEVRRGEGNIGRVIYDDQLYITLLSAAQRIELSAAQLQETLDSVNTLAKDADGVVADAGVIVKKAVGLGVEVDTFGRYGVSAEQLQAGASLRLIPASKDRWYRVGVSTAPDGVVYRRVKEKVDGSGTYQIEDLTETRYTFAVDAELARRFGFLTLHGGLLENTAGVGIDIQPVRWAALSGEVFNFRTGERPNLRGTLTVYPFFDPDSDKPWNWLYLQGGVSNALVDRRDYFFGAGLRFSDSEVKGLVGLVPALNN